MNPEILRQISKASFGFSAVMLTSFFVSRQIKRSNRS